jgi:hypothetical protein
VDCLGSIVCASAGDNRNPFVNLVETDFDDIFMLVKVEGCRLSGRATGDDNVGTVFDLEIDELTIGLLGELPLLA